MMKCNVDFRSNPLHVSSLRLRSMQSTCPKIKSSSTKSSDVARTAIYNDFIASKTQEPTMFLQFRLRSLERGDHEVSDVAGGFVEVEAHLVLRIDC